MRKFRKTLGVLCVIFMLFQVTNLAVFADSPSSWALAEVTEAMGKGLVLPEADGYYKENITRALFCKLIVNMVEVTTGSTVTISIANPFNDTNDSDIIKAHQLGIVNGVSATLFAPNDLITREQVAAMMMRAARKLDDLMSHHYTHIMLTGPPDFADLDQISSWALTDVHEANAIGIMMGIGGNQIAPKGNTTVEQSILMSLRVFNEYLPLIENAAPAQLPTAVVTYNVNEGESLDILLEDLAYDADGDALTISGVGGNLTYGRLMSHTAHVTFTAEEVDADQVSVWTVTVSDGIESVSIELTFNVIDVPAGKPESNGVTSFTINEGESISIKPSDIANDPEGDLMQISSYTLSVGYSSEIGDSIKYLALFGVENSFGFKANPVDGDTTTSYDLTVSDGTNESVFTIEIHVKEVNAPPVGLPMTTRHANENQRTDYSVYTIATDPDGDDLEIVSFELNDDPLYASAQHNLGTGSIIEGGTYYFSFFANELDMSMWTYYDITISDGLNEVVVTIRIQVNNVD